MYLDLLYNLSETFLILRTIQRDIITNAHRYSCKVPVILLTFYTRREFVGLSKLFTVV